MQNKQTNKQAGFTLIEIIAVLIILGILAAVATPKFMSMQRESRIAAVKSLKASMLSAAVMCHAKGSMTNANPLTPALVPDLAGNVQLQNGYPNNAESLNNAMSEEGFTVTGQVFHLDGRPTCGVTYGPAADPGKMPTFTEDHAGC